MQKDNVWDKAISIVDKAIYDIRNRNPKPEEFERIFSICIPILEEIKESMRDFKKEKED